MWPWPSKECPLDPQTRDWIERRWRWLTDEFGGDLLLDSANVLPTPEFFPDEYAQSDSAARTLALRVCQYMSVPEHLIEFEFYTDRRRLALVNERGQAIGGVAGTFCGSSRFSIKIERGQFHDPMMLVGTLAHELSHARLLGEGHVDSTVFDHELLTDLNVVFHGMGIFLANVPRHWESDTRTWPGANQPAPTYMTAAMFGYALALRCCQCMEPLPKWRRHLKPGVRAEFKQAYRFLTRQDPPA